MTDNFAGVDVQPGELSLVKVIVASNLDEAREHVERDTHLIGWRMPMQFPLWGRIFWQGSTTDASWVVIVPFTQAEAVVAGRDDIIDWEAMAGSKCPPIASMALMAAKERCVADLQRRIRAGEMAVRS